MIYKVTFKDSEKNQFLYVFEKDIKSIVRRKYDEADAEYTGDYDRLHDDNFNIVLNGEIRFYEFGRGVTDKLEEVVSIKSI